MSDPYRGDHKRSGREFLERRNALWAALRILEPGSAAFEDQLSALSALIGWDRARVLAGLGLSEAGCQPDPPL